MNSVDPVSIILIVIGSVLVYGSKNVLKLFKSEITEKKILIIKLTGLVIACAGMFKILQII